MLYWFYWNTNYYLQDNNACVAQMQIGYTKAISLSILPLAILQASGGVSSWIITYSNIILHSFPLYEFTLMVLIKVFNEVTSTQEYMSYLLFSPPGFLMDVYKTYQLSSKLTNEFYPFKVFSYKLSKRQLPLYVVSFSSYFSQWVFKKF